MFLFYLVRSVHIALVLEQPEEDDGQPERPKRLRAEIPSKDFSNVKPLDSKSKKGFSSPWRSESSLGQQRRVKRR
jgi:hypothetical protein